MVQFDQSARQANKMHSPMFALALTDRTPVQAPQWLTVFMPAWPLHQPLVAEAQTTGCMQELGLHEERVQSERPRISLEGQVCVGQEVGPRSGTHIQPLGGIPGELQTRWAHTSACKLHTGLKPGWLLHPAGGPCTM